MLFYVTGIVHNPYFVLTKFHLHIMSYAIFAALCAAALFNPHNINKFIKYFLMSEIFFILRHFSYGRHLSATVTFNILTEPKNIWMW